MNALSGISVEHVLTAAIRTTEMNHRFIANNIANADTPGYSPVVMDFQKTLREQVHGRGGFSLRKSRPRHMSFSSQRPQLEQRVRLSKNDFNKVDLDEEVARLAENTSKHTTYTMLLSKRFDEAVNMLRSLNR